MKIKVCGLMEPKNIKEIAALKPDMAGFIFHSVSPRFCGNMVGPFTLDSLPAGVKPVAVTVDLSEAQILDLASRYGFRTFQLHGNESPELCRSLRAAGYEVIKAIGIGSPEDMERTREYAGCVDAFIFDTKSPLKGGSGKKFDHTILRFYAGEEPFMLSGGIAPGDETLVSSIDHPKYMGVDLNSRFEISPGIKDCEKVRTFIHNVRRNENRDRGINRLTRLLDNKNEKLLAVYFTAGFPKADSVTEIIRALCTGGADIIEVGIPFSDPMADGVVIQHSSNVALSNGMTLSRLLDDVKRAREYNEEVPFVAMGYLNPIMCMGAENFFKRAKEAGIDGVIIPDLPFDIYMREYKELSRRYDIPMIMLITPETSEERIRLIDEHCEGFIYMVSTASTTGARDSFPEEAKEYFRRIDRMSLRHPRLIGFGISNTSTYSDACAHANGAIIGSQFIRLLESESSPEAAVEALMARIGRK